MEDLVSFGTECYVSGKVMHAAGGVLGVLRSEVKLGQATEAVAAMAGEQAGLSEAGRELAQTMQKMEQVAQEKVAQETAKKLIDAEKQLEKSTKAISAEVASQKSNSLLPVRCKLLTVSESVDKVRKYGGKIPARDIELFHNTKYWIEQASAQVNTKIERTLLERYNKMTQIAGNAEMSVCMDLEHTVNIQYRLIQDKSKTFYIVDLKGGHLAGMMSKLEQKGFVKIRSFVEFGGGCIEYQIEDLFTGRVFKHTEFPSHWNVGKIAQETKRLSENAMRDGLLTEQTKIPVEVVTYDGFKLRIITDPNPLVHDCAAIENTINRHIITSYPIYKG